MMRPKYFDVFATWRPHLAQRARRRLEADLAQPGLVVGVDGVRGELDKWPDRDELSRVRRLILLSVQGRRGSGAIVVRGHGCACDACRDLRAAGDVNTMACDVSESFAAPAFPIVFPIVGVDDTMDAGG